MLAPYARLWDVDSSDFAGGQLRVHIASGAGSSNRLALGGGFSVDASRNVLFHGLIIGTLNVDGGVGTEDLVVTFTANTTQEIVRDLLRSVTFKTVRGTLGVRHAVFLLTDGDGGTSDLVTKNICVS